jgi:hypothetical protein
MNEAALQNLATVALDPDMLTMIKERGLTPEALAELAGSQAHRRALAEMACSRCADSGGGQSEFVCHVSESIPAPPTVQPPNA